MTPAVNYRESVDCPVCSATSGEPCVFTEPQPRKPDGSRPVHAARYVLTLPESERAAFWEGEDGNEVTAVPCLVLWPTN